MYISSDALPWGLNVSPFESPLPCLNPWHPLGYSTALSCDSCRSWSWYLSWQNIHTLVDVFCLMKWKHLCVSQVSLSWPLTCNMIHPLINDGISYREESWNIQQRSTWNFMTSHGDQPTYRPASWFSLKLDHLGTLWISSLVPIVALHSFKLPLNGSMHLVQVHMFPLEGKLLALQTSCCDPLWKPASLFISWLRWLKGN